MILDAKFEEVGEINADFGAFMRGEKGEKGDKGDTGEVSLDYANKTFANAVIGSAEGEAVRVDDVSPVEHNISCRLTSDTITDFSSVKVSRYGKNLLPKIQSQSASGVTLSYTDDGSYILNGTCTQSYNFVSKTIILHEGMYTLSANNPSHNGLAVALVQVYSYENGKNIYVEDNRANGKMTLQLPYGKKYEFRIRVQEGINYNNFVIKPQLELGTTATAYEPYIEPTTYTPNADGTVEGITSISPTMTLLTDTEGAVIHCEYNRDTNKALGGAVVTKDGTVVSQNADFAEVAEWADGNPNNEDRTGYFVCANVPINGIVMKKATSLDDVKGVSILAPAFAGNYTKDKLDANGNLLPKYSYVAIIGFVPVIDNGTCEVGGRCMPDDNGCAIPSNNSMGYQVVNRIDDNRVLIIIEPNGDMVQRIKTKINELQEDVESVKLPITKGTGENSIVINEGIASGDYSIAGGTTDKEFIEGVVGETLSSIVNLNKAEAQGALSIALGADNIAQSSGSIALGYNNISGAKGYYFDGIDFANNTITLSTTRRVSTLLKPNYPSSVDWKVGDRLFIVNGDRFFLTITNVSGNIITVEELPFTEINYSTTLSVYTYSKPNDRTVVNIDQPKTGEVVLGWGAIGIGTYNNTMGSNSYAIGYKNTVAGDFGTAFGQENTVGYSAFATGVRNEALGKASHAEGNITTAKGFATHTEGIETKAIGNASHTEGYKTKASGDYSHAEGNGTSTSGREAHAEGYCTKAEGDASHTEGSETQAIVDNSHAEGYRTTAEGEGSHAEGYNTSAKGKYSHAEGYTTEAIGDNSHTQGCHTTAKGENSNAKGYYTTAEGNNSHAEGYATKALGNNSHAQGKKSVASAICSFVGGTNSVVGETAENGFAHGYDASATRYKNEVAFGNNNLEEDGAIFMIGNGYWGKNADGNSGNIKKNAFVVKSTNPNGSTDWGNTTKAWAEVDSQGETDKSVVILKTLQHFATLEVVEALEKRIAELEQKITDLEGQAN